MDFYNLYLKVFGKKEKWRLGGDFGNSLKENNLIGAFALADKLNQKRLEKLVKITGV